LYDFSGFTSFQNEHNNYVIAGTRLGNIHAYPLADGEFGFDNRQFIVDENSNIIRNPAIHSDPAYFKGPGDNEGLIVSSEGGVYYYQNTGAKDGKGDLIFNRPVHLQQEQPNLYGG